MTLKCVVLNIGFQSVNILSSVIIVKDIRLTPWYGNTDGPVIRKCIKYFTWIAVPSMIGAFLPKFGTIEVWIRDTEECKGCNRKGYLNGEEYEEGLVCAPFFGYKGARGDPHVDEESS